MSAEIRLNLDPTWGDNGKGRITDELAAHTDIVARFNGGDNAGHSVMFRNGDRVESHKLHGIPSGIFHPDVLSVIAGTTVMNPIRLAGEIKGLRSRRVQVEPSNLLISPDTQLIMPWHEMRDGDREEKRSRDIGIKIGTTRRGIGDTYSDHALREGFRMRDLLLSDEAFKKLLDLHLKDQERYVRMLRGEPMLTELNPDDFNDPQAILLLQEAIKNSHPVFDKGEILEDLREARDILAPMIQNVLPVLWDYQDRGKRILGEGAQGALLDLDLGGLPFVTSSHPTVAGFSLGTGIQDSQIGRVTGVTKAFSTRVGGGPMVTRLQGDLANRLRGTGQNPWDEYGATTGRPRDIGWLDAVALRYGIRISGIRDLAITKLDTLSGIDTLRICTGYDFGGTPVEEMATWNPDIIGQAKPIYEDISGWDEDISQVRSFDALPPNTQHFVRRVGELTKCPVSMLSVGPIRGDTINID